MTISLRKAYRPDLPLIHHIQRTAFMPLYEKYHDHQTSPAVEPIHRIIQRFEQPCTTYYLICADDMTVGFLRVFDLGDCCRLSPICILPEHQGNGYAQQAITLAIASYSATTWELETIAQEKILCYLYEKMGFHKTGGYLRVKDGMDLVSYSKDIYAHKEK
ncbi:MAG: GNAT family N-acetyltransferase [Oscillospiraceae bacterium]|nr:GNAT family N-acetyltransferase [Oscillospiraceae bacterium]